jgi:uncharacterized protein (TIGR02246 family)
MRSDEEALRATHTTWIDAVNAGDLDTLLRLMTPDAMFLNPGQAPSGRDDFPAGFLGAHREFVIQCTSDLQEVGIRGDLAFAIAKDALTLTPRAGGATERLAGHRLSIYRKNADGDWQLARDAHTLTPAS